MAKLSAVIVDDERLARRRIQRLLLEEPDISICEECATVSQASEAIKRRVPDVLFLDIRMPGAGGFDLLGGIDNDAAPALIFVTAFEEYAVRAFEVHACDYLLKPVDQARLRVALQRAKDFLRGRTEENCVCERVEPTDSCLLSNSPATHFPAAWERQRSYSRMLTKRSLATGASSDFLLIRSGPRVYPLKLDAVGWIEAAGNYVNLHAEDGKTYLLREALSAFERTLPEGRFARIHRSAIVNMDRVREFRQAFNGDFFVLLADGRELRMSRMYRTRVRDLFGRPI